LARILLVEDNEMNLDMLSRRLERRGHQILVAMDGSKGVQLALQEQPDLILMDMSLPVMDGWEATRTIRRAPNGKDIPIIALTAHAIAGDRERCLEAGCNDYESKPVKFPVLLAKIESLLGITSSGESSGE
jgi:two-component system, cell cycle response regulator DivK